MGLRLTVRGVVARLVWPASGAHAGARTVLLHEWLMTMGGSDKVAAELAEAIDAEVAYVYALNDDLVDRLNFEVPVVTWRFGRLAARFGRLPVQLPLMPLVWRCLDLTGADLVVSSSHCATNAAHPREARSISYVHTPMRYAWDWRLERERTHRAVRWVLPIGAKLFRAADRRWSRRVDTFVSNSVFVEDRIRRYYGRSATVVPPPIDLDYWAASAEVSGDPNGVNAAGAARPYFIVAGRLVAYKQIHVAVMAANELGIELVVAGSGPELERLQRIAGPTVRFVERPEDQQLRSLLCSATALLFPGVEDFGMLPLEAQATGTPVIARGAGGALETVRDGVTGVFVDSDDPADWARAMANFDPSEYERAEIEANAALFSTGHFRRRMREVLTS